MDEIDPAAVERGYDALAAAYAAHLYGEHAHKPFDRWWLQRFASLVQGHAPVLDLGCGPGHVARFLSDLGVAHVVGVDLSEGMLREARRLNPEKSFKRGDMLALPYGDADVGGIVAFYAIVHFTPGQLAVAFREMHRVLRPGGAALVAFHVEEVGAPRAAGEAHSVKHVEELFGVRAALDFVLHDVDAVVGRIRDARLTIEDVTLRYPYPVVEAQTKRAYVLARRPAPAR